MPADGPERRAPGIGIGTALREREQLATSFVMPSQLSWSCSTPGELQPAGPLARAPNSAPRLPPRRSALHYEIDSSAADRRAALRQGDGMPS